MRISNLSLAAAAGAVLMTTVGLGIAGGHSPIEQRQAAMKAVGKATGTIGKMMKGETEFDAAAANAAFADMQTAAEGYADMFPEGSTEGKTRAAPAIWADPDGFAAAVAKFQTDIAAAVAAAPADKAAVGASFGSVAQNCNACHEDYRTEDS